MAARILAAHLGAEGIVWQLRGEVDGPYPVGPVEVLVPADDLEVARALVAAAESEPPEEIADSEPPGEIASADVLDDPPEQATSGQGRGVRATIIITVLVLVVLFALGRVLLLGR
jgi:hypothetical protein